MGNSYKNVLFAHKWPWLGIFGLLASPLKAKSAKIMGGNPESAQPGILFKSFIKQTTATQQQQKENFLEAAAVQLGTLDIEKFTECNVPSHIQVLLCSVLALPACYYFFCTTSKTSRTGQDLCDVIPISAQPSCVYFCLPSFLLCGLSLNFIF